MLNKQNQRLNHKEQAKKTRRAMEDSIGLGIGVPDYEEYEQVCRIKILYLFTY